MAGHKEQELCLLNKTVRWTPQSLAQLLQNEAGALAAKEGLTKGQFQQILRKLELPLPRTGPFSSPLNNRLYAAFDVRSCARVTFEDFLDAFTVFSSNDTFQKLKLSFKAFDSDNTGTISNEELSEALKDIAAALYPGEKSRIDLLHVFVEEVMNRFHEGKKHQHLNFEQFCQVAALSAQTTALFTLGSTSAAYDPSSATGSPINGRKMRNSSERRTRTGSGKQDTDANVGSPSDAPISPEIGQRKRAGSRGTEEIRTRKHSGEDGAAQSDPRKVSSEATERSKKRHSDNAKRSMQRDAAQGRRNTAASNQPTNIGELRSPRGGTQSTSTTNPTATAVTQPQVREQQEAKKNHKVEEEEEDEAEETMEEMNARLVKHIRALQVELRKYMKMDEENKERLKEYEEKVTTLERKNEKLVHAYKKERQKSRKMVDAKTAEAESNKEAWEKEISEKLADKYQNVEQKMQNLKCKQKDFNALLHFMVEPHADVYRNSSLINSAPRLVPAGEGIIPNALEQEAMDAQITKIGYMVKRGDVFKSWKKRLFIMLENGKLLYYADAERPPPRGSLDLHDVVMVRKAKPPVNAIELTTRNRVWVLATSTEEETNEWVETLTRWIERYKRPQKPLTSSSPNTPSPVLASADYTVAKQAAAAPQHG
ncbi:Pleckstrin y domain-containing A member 2 [Balamuthia mandrillaris]